MRHPSPFAVLAGGAAFYLGYRLIERSRRRYDFAGKCVIITGGARVASI